VPITSKDSVSFIKIDAFHTKAHHLFEDKLKLVWQAQAGIMRPIGINGRTAVNDRFFITQSLGYTHLGHCFDCLLPKE